MSGSRDTAPHEVGSWNMAALALLPPGEYTWHHFPQRGYRALAGRATIASLVPVRPRGWSLRLTGFTWHGTGAGPAALAGGSGEMRWFPSSRRAMATAGELLAAAPQPRRERPPPPHPVDTETGGPTQAAFAF